MNETSKDISGLEPEIVDACLVCGSLSTVVDRWASEYRSLRPPYSIVRCLLCGFRQMSPRPSALHFARYYAGLSCPLLEEYGNITGFYSDESGLRSKQYEWDLKIFDANLERGARLLEVGCWTGDFLALAQQRGYSVTGVEPSVSAAEIARARTTATIHVGDIEHLGSEPNCYDAVYASHVLEHLYEPKAALAKIWECLRPGGILIAEVPCEYASARGMVSRLFRRSGIPTPGSSSVHHTCFYDRSTLARLVRGAGVWSDVRVTGRDDDTFVGEDSGSIRMRLRRVAYQLTDWPNVRVIARR
jgi:SAM-dependent methyltransferase